MTATPILDRLPNNFGVIRLALAFAVVVSHSPEMVDGDRSREILSMMFGTASFGEAAVAGFFVISGYLISKSFIQGRSAFAYFLRRVARIVPGFVLAFAFSVAVAALVTTGSNWSLATFLELAKQLATLRAPTVEGAFAGLPHPYLNGSLWTIAYEFRCYIAVAVFGWIGLYRPRLRWLFLALTVGLLLADATRLFSGLSVPGSSVLGAPDLTIRFLGVFCVGACFNLFEDRLRLSGKWALASAVLLVPLMFSDALHRAAMATLGGYVLLWLATAAPQWRPGTWTDRVDLSYGLYLFAWPIQNLIIWTNRDVNPWLLCVLATAFGLSMAWGSFFWVERPAQNIAKGWLSARRRRLEPATAST